METLLSILSSIRWQDIIDISLNSYILFRLYIFFRDTHVFRILLGLALLWFFQRLSVSQGMIITSWVLQGLTAAAVFIIIVVFRNEIFSILQTSNLKTLFWGIPAHTIKTSEECITESLFELAQRHHGALIVFPGKDSLEDVVQSGIPWNGTVSKEMILTIFWPNNSVHDGAILIQGNKVTQVGSILPLSQRKDLPSHYGTRHRAAAGLAESTDALVLLVSEERGTIIAAKGNDLTPLSRKEDIIAVLQQHLGSSLEDVHTIRRKKVRTVMAGFISVLIITSLWLSFTRGQTALIALDIPIKFVNQRPEVRITDWSVDSVRVQLAGSSSLMRNIRPENVQMEIDIKNVSTGLTTFHITKDNIKRPPGITVKNIHPDTVNANLDMKITKELPVQVDWVGKLNENLILEKVVLVPDKLKISGWEQTLDKKTTLYTEPVSLNSIKKSGVITVQPLYEEPSMKVAADSPERVRVMITVKERELPPVISN